MSKRIRVYDKYNRTTVRPHEEPPAVDYEKVLKDNNYQLEEFTKWLDELEETLLFRARMFKALAIALVGLAIVIGIGLWTAVRGGSAESLFATTASNIIFAVDDCGKTITPKGQQMVDTSDQLVALYPDAWNAAFDAGFRQGLAVMDLGLEKTCATYSRHMAQSGYILD